MIHNKLTLFAFAWLFRDCGNDHNANLTNTPTLNANQGTLSRGSVAVDSGSSMQMEKTFLIANQNDMSIQANPSSNSARSTVSVRSDAKTSAPNHQENLDIKLDIDPKKRNTQNMYIQYGKVHLQLNLYQQSSMISLQNQSSQQSIEQTPSTSPLEGAERCIETGIKAFDNKEYTDAIELFEMALSFLQQIDEHVIAKDQRKVAQLQGQGYRYLAESYQEINVPDKARANYLLARKAYTSIQDWVHVSICSKALFNSPLAFTRTPPNSLAPTLKNRLTHQMSL